MTAIFLLENILIAHRKRFLSFRITSTRDMCNALKDHVAKVEENLQRGKYYDFIHILLLIYGVQPTLPTTLLILLCIDGQIYILSLVTWAWKRFLDSVKRDSEIQRFRDSIKLATNQYAMLNKVGK